MADSTYTVRVDQETKDQLQKLQTESGKTQSEFYKEIAAQLQLDQLKEDGVATEEIEELQLHTKRIAELVVSMITRGQSIKDMHDQQLKELQADYKKKDESQAAKIEQLIKEKEQAEDESQKNYENYFNVKEQLINEKLSLDRANALIEEYKEKIQNLSILATENQRKANDYDNLNNEIKVLKWNLEALEQDKKKAEGNAESAQDALQEIKEKNGDLNIVLEQMKAELSEYKLYKEHAEKDKEVAIREAVAQTREEYLAKVEEYQVKLDQYIQEIRQLQSELLICNQKPKEVD